MISLARLTSDTSFTEKSLYESLGKTSRIADASRLDVSNGFANASSPGVSRFLSRSKFELFARLNRLDAEACSTDGSLIGGDVFSLEIFESGIESLGNVPSSNDFEVGTGVESDGSFFELTNRRPLFGLVEF